jgi:hypothetical protein
VSTDPAFVRAQINEAEKRAGRRQVRLLIVALIGLGVIAAFAVAGFFLSYSQARKNGDLTKRVIAQGVQIKLLTEQLAGLAQAQAANSVQGRALIQKVVDLTTVIAGFTDPTSKAAMDQQAKIAAAIKSLLAGQQIQSADLLRKLGEIAVVLAPPDRMAEVQAAVAKILAEPAPPIVIPSVPSAKASTVAMPTPTPSRSPFLQVQCPVICPQPP